MQSCFREGVCEMRGPIPTFPSRARKHPHQRLMWAMATGIRTSARTDWLPNGGRGILCRARVQLSQPHHLGFIYQLATNRYFILPISLCEMRLYTYILRALSPSASAV
jgi:hypothetical protein